MKTQMTRILITACLSSGIALAQVTVPGAQSAEPVTGFFSKLLLFFTSTPARMIVVVGVAFYFATMLFGSRHDHSGLGWKILGAVGLISVQNFVSFWIG